MRWLALAGVAFAPLVLAQDYPNKPIHFIVGFAPGGVAPAGTPRANVMKLNSEILRALQLPDIGARFAAKGAKPGQPRRMYSPPLYGARL